MSLDFDLSEEQQMIRKMVRNFAEKEIAPIAQELDDKEEFSYTLTRRMGKPAFSAPLFRKNTAGRASDTHPILLPPRRSHGLMARRLPPSPQETLWEFHPSTMMGNEEQRKKLAA